VPRACAGSDRLLGNIRPRRRFATDRLGEARQIGGLLALTDRRVPFQSMAILPAEMYVKLVPGDEDLVQFSYNFTLDGKALDDGSNAPTVTEDDNGDLIIAGYAAVWDGDDREGENFAPGAFQRGIKAFLNSQAALCFHHKHDHVLGKVLELEEEGKGLRMRARVDGAIKNHPVLGTYYHQIKSGTLNGLSIGGFFKRALIAGKQKIVETDFTELSVTGVPVHTGPSFNVIAGKALTQAAVEAQEPDDNVELEDLLAQFETFFDAMLAKPALS
jgi:HK97 family phage prohead protease